tara:strand:+ start:172 stop:705 length:534 start_codon:yes stop_codon:yes gene_type:complete
MSEPPEWRTPAIGLLVVGGLLLCGGGLKLSAANRSFFSSPTKAQSRYPKRKPYRPKPPPPITVVPPSPLQPQRPSTTQIDTAPGAEDRETLRSDPDGNSRAFAATSLANYRPVQDATITVLVEALQDQDSLVRSSAADTLGQLGRSARRARGALYQLRRDPDPEVRRAVTAALRKIR